MTDRHDNSYELPKERDEASHEKKKLILFVSVTGVMVVIIAAWLFLLPSQLGPLNPIGAQERAQWRSIRADTVNQAQTFEETMEGYRSQLREASEDLLVETIIQTGGEAKVAPLLSNEELKNLRNRIEAATATYHTEDNVPE